MKNMHELQKSLQTPPPKIVVTENTSAQHLVRSTKQDKISM